jgi:hypothetical protein
MKFNEILHPEVAFDKRGSESIRNIYREFLQDVDYSREGFTVPKEFSSVIIDPKFGRDFFESAPGGNIQKGNRSDGQFHPSCFLVKPRLMDFDDNSRDHFCFVKKFKVDSGKIYHINKDFLSVLSEINREIPIDCLPDRFLGYISFPQQSIKDDTGFIQGAYVFIGDAKETTLSPEYWGNKTFWCSYLEEGNNLTVTELRAVLFNKTMEKIISETFHKDYLCSKDPDGTGTTKEHYSNAIQQREKIFRTIINAIIYIFCQNPVLNKVTSFEKLSYSQKIKAKAVCPIVNETAFPITFVNWQYKRLPNYSKHKTNVCGYFRQQRHGPHNSFTKAIYIEEHERILNQSLEGIFQDLI